MKAKGLGSIYQRGRIWWVQFSVGGRLHRESSRSSKRSDATKLLKQRLAEMGSGKPVGGDLERTTIEDLGNSRFRKILDEFLRRGESLLVSRNIEQDHCMVIISAMLAERAVRSKKFKQTDDVMMPPQLCEDLRKDCGILGLDEEDSFS